MPGLVEFATYFGMGLGFMALYVVLYLYATPHREITLIRGDNLPAAVVLAGAVLGFAHGVRLFTRAAPPQKLDDEPPPAAPRTPVRFGSDRF